jgi:hypothetical protein
MNLIFSGGFRGFCFQMMQTAPIFVFPESCRRILLETNTKNMDAITVAIKNRIPNTLDRNMNPGCLITLESIVSVIDDWIFEMFQEWPPKPS